MDIKTKKLHFVQGIPETKGWSLIDKLSELLKLEKKKKVEKEMKALNQKEFNELIDSAESDSENGRLTSARKLKSEIDSWN